MKAPQSTRPEDLTGDESDCTLRGMAMAKRKERQESMWIATSELPTSPGHPFYQRLNELRARRGVYVGPGALGL